jgi:hypothetical protein
MITTSQNYVNENSFRTYIDYLALKKHFTTKGYDYHKYNGKVKASFQTFQNRKDAFFFYKLSRKREAHDILVSNLSKNPNAWIRDIVDENGFQIYEDWIKRKESLSYFFKLELNKLEDDYKSNFVVPSGQHPRLLTLYLQKHISLETFSILTHLSKVLDHWEKEVVDKIVAGDIIHLSRKYYPFLEIEEKKFSKIVKDKFF